jgi:hypothetical protein
MVFSVVSAVLAVSNTSQAVTILSGPSFTKATNASLAGTLQLTYVTYRSHRVPDLYGYPAVAVADLNLEYNAGVPHLQFSGDPFRTYSIEISTDLQYWTDIGTVAPGAGGNYDFDDTVSGNAACRYYRVVTQ